MPKHMKRSHKRKSRRSRRTRKRRGGFMAKGAPGKTGVFQKGDLSLGKGAAAAVKKGVAAEKTAMKMCNTIKNQFARKVCTEKVVKAQKKRAAAAKKLLEKADAANAVAKKNVGLVQSRIGAIEKQIAANKAKTGAGKRRRKSKRRRSRKRRR